MATRSALFIQTANGEWLRHYCHFDGYPGHMLPALEKADPQAILRAQELRQIRDDGSVEAFAGPRAPDRTPAPDWPGWAEHAYVLTASGWRHAPTPEALAHMSRL